MRPDRLLATAGVCACAMFLLSGCGVSALVAAYNDPAIEYERSYFITSGMDDVPDGDLEFRQFAGYLSNALEATGYRATDRDSADLEIRFSYGMGAPREEVSSSYNAATKTHSNSTSTTYFKQVTIIAIQGDAQVWKVNVSSNFGGSNLPRMIPYMIVAAQDYFGQSANRNVSVFLKDRKVRAMRKE